METRPDSRRTGSTALTVRDAERPRVQRPGESIIDRKPRPGRVRYSGLLGGWSVPEPVK